jgi:hypothetical protein
MKQDKRENGYYWVTWGDVRIIAQYYNKLWYIPGENYAAGEKELRDINENRIIENGK